MNKSQIDKALILFILQIVTLFNVSRLGWSVKRINKTTYKISKYMDNPKDFDVDDFLNKLIAV